MSLSSHQEIQILHVDDDPSITDLTGTFLERDDERFTVETATSADEGLENITDRPPDCVVSDYNMPGTDGIEFLQAVREEYPDLPFILYTGKGSEAVASEAIAADVTDYLQKESGSEQYELLANRIRNAVRARREAERADRQEQLMRLTEFLGDTGGFEFDRESNTILLTAGTRRIIGRPDTFEITLEEALELFHPDDREGIQHTLDRAFKTGEELHDRWRLQPDDGDERLLDITITPVVENGEVTKLRGAGHDITDRTEHQRKLTQIETLFQHTQDSLFLIDAGEEFTVERVNPAWEDAMGISAEQIQDKTPRDVLGEQQGAVSEDKFHECVQRQEPLQYEETARLNGKLTYWETRIAPVVIGGTVEYIAGATRDITEQRQRQQELEEYGTIIEALTDAVYVLDEEGQFTYVNDEFVELVGYDRETILGNTPSLIKNEDAVRRAEQELGRLLSSDGPETVMFEVTIHTREGGPIVCEDHMGVLPYEGDQFDGSVGTLRDITDQKARERKLKAVNSQYQTLIESYPDGAIFLYDTDLRVVRAGGSELSEVGLSREEIEETTPRDRYPPEIAEELVGTIENVLAGESHTFEQEYQGEHYRVQIVPVGMGQQEVTHAMAVSQNITDQTENRRELKGQNERLDEFASIVSHDLRSPLGVAEGHLELAAETCESDHLARATDAIDRSQALIDDLLALAREGDRVDETEPVEIAKVAERSWQTVETRQATLDADESGIIAADRNRLQQLFENLYRNAVEHGGDDVIVSVGALDDGFYVADSGPGIPEADREDAFDAGYSTNEDGTGFGLRIVEQIAVAHGWEVAITESEEGGARFDITGVEKGA